jgi:hypothetical protein
MRSALCCDFRQRRKVVPVWNAWTLKWDRYVVQKHREEYTIFHDVKFVISTSLVYTKLED